MVRAFVLDVDRTLLTDDHVVLPPVRDALRRLRQRGVAIVLATARSRRGLDPVLLQIDRPDALICCNGAWIGGRRSEDDGFDTIIEHRLELSVAQAAVRFAHHPAILASWYADEDWYVPADTPMVRHEIHVTGETPIITNLGGVAAPPHKLLLIAEDPAAIPHLEATGRAFAQSCSASFSHRNFLELTAPGVTKAAGLVALGTYLGIGSDDIAAIGDGHNDLGMIAAAAIGIAMGNAVDEAKHVAAWTTTTNQNAGLALAVDRLIDAGHV